jgi:hypothetical protein
MCKKWLYSGWVENPKNGGFRDSSQRGFRAAIVAEAYTPFLALLSGSGKHVEGNTLFSQESIGVGFVVF